MAADLSYPIGKFQFDPAVTPATRARCIESIRRMPADMKTAVAGLTDEQLDTPYRPGGWTIRQVVHHVPDSHMHSYIRFHWTLTEDDPLIKAYDQDAWANLADGKSAPVGLSLALLEALHARWVILLESMRAEDFERRLQHPESGRLTLDIMLQLYAWHGAHHVAHVTGLRERMGW